MIDNFDNFIYPNLSNFLKLDLDSNSENKIEQNNNVSNNKNKVEVNGRRFSMPGSAVRYKKNKKTYTYDNFKTTIS